MRIDSEDVSLQGFFFFQYLSKRACINETKRVTHITNLKIDFSGKCLSDDIAGQYYISNRSNYTPYKPEEINNEIYPNENFMKYNNTNNIAHKIINKKCNSNNNDNVSICSTEISFSSPFSPF